MKILDNSELQKNSGSKPKDKNVNLTDYRKKKKRSKHLFKLIVFALAVVAIILVWVNAATIFEPLRGIASKIETKTSYDVGFPINLPGSTGYSFKKFGDCFSLLTDTYLYTYETNGAQVYALKHGYSNPEQVTNSKRVLLFDKSSYSFAIYSKTSLIYQKTLEDKIVYTAIGDNNLSAIVTDSSRYSNILYIYDDGGNWKYTRKFADENVMQVCFTNDNEHIIVSTISVDGGEIVTNIYKLSIKSKENEIWKYSFKSNSLPCGMYADKNDIMLICDNTIASVNYSDGTLNGSYPYSGALKCFSVNDEVCVIQYNETSTNKNLLVMLDRNAQPVTVASVTSNVLRVAADDDGIYVLDGSNLKVFDNELMNEAESHPLNDDYSDFVRIGKQVFLLGYDTVDMMLA